jgi:hypothetical protein
VRLPVGAVLVTSGSLVLGFLVTGLTLILRPAALPDALSSVVGLVSGIRDRGAADVSGLPVRVDSEPAGASVWQGGRQLGQTPATITVTADQLLILRRDGFLDAVVRASGSHLDVALWRAQPTVRPVRPPMPGAAIRSAGFLPDGRIALAVEVPPTGERQPWAYDPASARLERLGHGVAPGTLPGVVAIALDGRHTAAILRLDGLDGVAADQLTFDAPHDPHQPLSGLAAGERLLDVTWSPQSDGVLLLSQRRLTGGMQFHLRWVSTDGEARDIASLPSEPVAGSWVWAPDGHAVAFLVHTRAVALVALEIVSGELRYLDDLRPDGLPGSGAVAPATWEASGGLLYAAPAGGRGFPDSFTTAAPVLFEVAAGRVDAHRVGDVEPVWAPIVRPDGVLLTLARDQNDALVLRPVTPSGHALAEQSLGVRVSGPYAARWDLRHQQLLIVRGAAGGVIEVLLLRFGAENPPAGGHASGTTSEASR